MPTYKDIDAILRNLPDDLPYKASVKRVLIQAPEADVVPSSEVRQRDYLVMGIMHFVDKWLDDEELEQDPFNRAATMREKTLRIVENMQSHINRLKKYDEERDIALHARLVAKAKVDGALEVIGDIETLSNNHTRAISMLEPQNGFCEGGKQAFDIVLRFLAELKKKYTEVEK